MWIQQPTPGIMLLTVEHMLDKASSGKFYPVVTKNHRKKPVSIFPLLQSVPKDTRIVTEIW